MAVNFLDRIFLLLDEIIPANVRAAILAENPNTVEVLGQKVAVEYSAPQGWGSITFCAKVRLTEALARQAAAQPNSIPTLPSGRQLILVCEFMERDFEASDINELVKKIEAHRIGFAWQTARQAHEISDSTANMAVISAWLTKIYSSVEITKADNNSGEPIMGWFSLESRYSGSYFFLRLRDSLAQAQEETMASLAQLLQKQLAEVLQIPQAEPFQTNSGWYGWRMTEIGQALQTRFQKILEGVAGEITATNIQEKIESAKQLAEIAKAEVGGNYSSCQTLIREIEEKVNDKTEEISWSDRDFVRSELEQISNLIQEAKQALQGLNYEQARENCSKAVALADSLTGLVQTRTAARDQANQAFENIRVELYSIYQRSNDFQYASDGESSRACILSDEITNLICDSQFDEAVGKMTEAQEFIDVVKVRLGRLEDILTSEYTHCPVCGNDLDRNYSHTCDEAGQGALMASGNYAGLKVKVSKIGDKEFVVLIAEYSERYSRFELRLEVHPEVMDANPGAEILTESFFREPSPRERELAVEIANLKQQIGNIERERGHFGRVEIKLVAGISPKGEAQMSGEANFTGRLSRRVKRPDGTTEDEYKDFVDQTCIFVFRTPVPWLETQPQAGEKWLCTAKFLLSMSGSKPIVVANPQVRSDLEQSLRAKLAELERALEEARNSADANSLADAGEISEDMLKALKQRFEKK